MSFQIASCRKHFLAHITLKSFTLVNETNVLAEDIFVPCFERAVMTVMTE